MSTSTISVEPKIIFEDNDLLVVDKPAGWITNSASTTKDQPVVQNWIKENFDFEIAKSEEFRSGIVHRLDKETSGILLIAKTKNSFEDLQKQFKERKVQKTYIALAHGKIEPEDGTINEPVGRLPWRRDRFGVLPGGREAETNYKVIKHYKKDNEDYSLVELKPKTGRTHQIRIHLKHIGHPIVADEFYAGRKTARKDRKWCPRLFLHAGGIMFLDPKTDKEVLLESKLADDLSSSLHVFTDSLV